MAKVVHSPPPGDMSWIWYRPDDDGYRTDFARITCGRCDVNFSVPRTLVRIKCFSCGRFLKRPYFLK